MRTEKVLALLFLIGLLFKLLHWTGSGFILVITLYAVVILYFPAAFYFFCDKDIERQNLPLSIFSGLFLSLIPLGILFKIMYWQGGQIFLEIGSVTAPIFFAITYFLKSKATDDLKIYYKNLYLRTSILTALTLVFCFTPTRTLLKVQYWDDPELAKLKISYFANPDNMEHKKQLDEYILKRDSLKLNK